MTGQDEPRDLAALVVPQDGRLERAEDPWETYQMLDPAGILVGPVAAFLRDLQASGRPETTLRAYAIALLRWYRFLWAAGVPWDQATRAAQGPARIEQPVRLPRILRPLQPPRSQDGQGRKIPRLVLSGHEQRP